MNPPLLNRLSGQGMQGSGAPTQPGSSVGLEDHHDESRLAQRRADKWMIVGAALMGMWAPGLLGFPIFMRGVWLQRQALRAGLSVRPMIVTLIGYLVLIDGMLNSLGWALDLVANHTSDQPGADGRLGQHVRRGLLLALQRAVGRRRGGARRKGLCRGVDPDGVLDAGRRGDRVFADEAVGAPVAGRHLLDGRGDLVRLCVQHDDVSPTCATPVSCSRSSAGGSTTSSTSLHSSRSRTCTLSTAKSSPTEQV